MVKNRKSQEELISNFNDRINRENWESGFHKNVYMTGSQQGIDTVRNWAGDVADALDIGIYDVFNTPNKFSSDIDIHAGGGEPWDPQGRYTPAGSEIDWEALEDPNIPDEDVPAHLRNQQLFLSEEGRRHQEGYIDRNHLGRYPKANILGHELWHSKDINFKQEKPEKFPFQNRGTELDAELWSGPTNWYDRDKLGLDEHLNAFGGWFGPDEWNALQRSWDRMPNQWTVDPKRSGYAGQNNDKYIKDDQMRDALVNMYLNSENFQHLPPESRGAIAEAMATALSSGEYEQNLGRDGLETIWYPEIPEREPGNPHPKMGKVEFMEERMKNPWYGVWGSPTENTYLQYLNSPDERTSRFMEGFIGKGFDPDWRFGTKDSDEQRSEVQKALGNWWRSD